MKLLLFLLAGIAALMAGCAAQEDTPEEARVIDVEVSRYRFDPGTGFALNVSRGETVVLRLTSLDVTHGFSILEYGINVEVPPGAVVEVRFTADKAGDFTIYCTVFCGSGHPQHKGTLHVA